MIEINFTEEEWNFLIKEFSNLVKWNPDDKDIEKNLKIVIYAKMNNMPELIFLWMYGYFKSAVDPETGILEDYSPEERRIIENIWKKLEKLKTIYGDPSYRETESRLGIDIEKIEKELEQIKIKIGKNK